MSAFPRPESVTRESLIVLSTDSALVETLQILGHDHDIFTVGAESDLAAQLIAEHAGVAIIDAQSVTSPIEKLTDRLKSQFPDLVLIVAGGIDDQSALATQITGGTVYRFLHKPVSEQRVRLFVEAAWRRHGQEHAGVIEATGTLPILQPQRTTTLPPALLVGGGAALGALALLAVWFALRKPDVPHPATPTAGTSDASLATTAKDEVLESLLARADKAFAAGAYVNPPEENAADLYAQARRRNANDPRAGEGLEKVIDRLLSAAEQQLLAQHIDEAQKLTDQARAIKPDHVRVAFLTAEIGKERERAVLMQAREAAASGNIEQAIAVLDGSKAGRSSLVAEARRELEQKKFDDRVSEYLRKSADRVRRGQLIEPTQDNARFYIESARAIAPNDTNVKQAARQLGERLVAEARKSLTAGNADQADRWIQAATDTGVSRDDVNSLTREEQRVRTTAKADAMARLALLFNQRLTQGKVDDPANDSAKFYLAQLVQADATHPSTLLARQSFATRTLDEARGAVRKQDYVSARRWLTEAHDAGADDASIADVNRDIAGGQTSSKPTAAPQAVSAGALQRTHYVAPDFPPAAATRGLSGWVDVQFTVKSDGTTTDVSIVEAEPVGVFEQSAMEAVRKWHYRPVVRNGQTVDQLARVRVRFALQ